jgi:hypothetical protein
MPSHLKDRHVRELLIGKAIERQRLEQQSVQIRQLERRNQELQKTVTRLRNAGRRVTPLHGRNNGQMATIASRAD